MAEMKKVLPSLVKVMPKTQFDKIDLKQTNRLKRLKRQKKHSAQKRRKKKFVN